MPKGGAKWKEGADTCVFKPAVTCQGEAGPRAGVSRIMRRELGVRDEFIERRIRETFPELVEAGRVAVHSVVCVPQYTADDIGRAEGFVQKERGGCSKLGNLRVGVNRDHANFITAEFIGPVFKYFDTERRGVQRLSQWRNVLLDALDAGCRMVPDAGPWIVHADCHFGNILYREEDGVIKTALSDWGRTLYIENPNDINSVREGIIEWLRPLVQNVNSLGEIRRLFLRYRGSPQHPQEILDPIFNLLSEDMNAQDFRQHMAILRGWVPYVVIKQATDELGGRDNLYDMELRRRLSRSNELLTCPNRATLTEKVMRILRTVPEIPRAAAPVVGPVALRPEELAAAAAAVAPRIAPLQPVPVLRPPVGFPAPAAAPAAPAALPVAPLADPGYRFDPNDFYNQNWNRGGTRKKATKKRKTIRRTVKHAS